MTSRRIPKHLYGVSHQRLLGESCLLLVIGGSQGIVITWVTCCWHYPLVCLVE
ncbi:hypothetical protein OIU78_002984 [Salix suchowensis]|nr:hypothetical protein OIU78_002984 [Salix suchowensis]